MLSNQIVTRHAETRMQQRGWKSSDLDLFLDVASQVEPETYLLTDKDASREIARRKREIQSLERLRGKKVVVVDGSTIVTCCHSRRSDQKRCIRKGRRSQ